MKIVTEGFGEEQMLITEGYGGLLYTPPEPELGKQFRFAGGGAGFRKFFPQEFYFPETKVITLPKTKKIIYPCPYCEFKSPILIKLAKHIREAHPGLIVQSTKIFFEIAMKYKDAEVLIIPPEDIPPETFEGKPLIATETIKISVKIDDDEKKEDKE